MSRVVLECKGRLANHILCWANARHVLDALGLTDRTIVINHALPENCVQFPGAVACVEDTAGLPRVARAQLAEQSGDCLWIWQDIYHDFPPADVMKDIIQGIELDEAFADQIGAVICHDRFVGIHARFGDFVAVDPSDPPPILPPFIRGTNDYFLNTMEACRRAIPGVEFFLASDGTPEELEFITSQPNVVKGRPEEPLFDLFALSECRMIIGSASTFSSIAAQYGNAPWSNPTMSTEEIAVVIQESLR